MDTLIAYIRQIAIIQKLNEKPQPTTASVQTVNPTPMSLNGFTLQSLMSI